MKYLVIAGEASGDLHASHLMTALKEADPQASFEFLGGDLMAEAAGHAPLVHYRDMAFMGFIDVVRHLGKVTDNLNTAREAVNRRPDALILVDYPSFNLRVAAEAFKLGVPVYYYISPKVWAWKEGRVKKIKKYVRKMYSILPFEVDFYRSRHNWEVMYVGNPSAEEVDARRRQLPSREEFMNAHGLDSSRPMLALVPGSRVSEIKNNLSIMKAVAARHPEYQAVVTAAPSIDPALYTSIAPDAKVVSGATFDVVAHADAALVTSGTATLEAALLGTPQVVCFRHGGSKLVYNMYKRLLKIPYVSLPNLIADEEIVPEMLMHLCTVDSVDRELCKILPGAAGRDTMLAGYERMRNRLGTTPAASTAAGDLIKNLTTQARD